MKFKSALMIVVSLWLMSTPAAAADKTHQQLLAEIRMLQEQQSQLQQMLGGLADTLKTMSTKMDDQTTATRKGFADQMLVINGIADGVRVLREKSDDTNVRLATMTQEIESMRQAIQTAPVAAPPAAVTTDPTGAPPTGVQPPTPTQPSGSGLSPTKAYDAAFNDYTSGQYDLAIQGFEFYIREFPTSPRADDAQLGIGNSYLRARKLPGCRHGVSEGHRQLQPDGLRAAGVLQAGIELRGAEAAGVGAPRLRDGDQEPPDRAGCDAGQAAAR